MQFSIERTKVSLHNKACHLGSNQQNKGFYTVKSMLLYFISECNTAFTLQHDLLFTTQSQLLTTLKKKPFENIVRKGLID